jgi:hypothetical protein
MLKCEIVVDMDNAAFDDGQGGCIELSRILDEVADKLKCDGSATTEYLSLRDARGNTVGNLQITETPERNS